MSNAAEPIRLTPEDVAYLLMMLRNTSSPMTTAELIEALRQRSSR